MFCVARITKALLLRNFVTLSSRVLKYESLKSIPIRQQAIFGAIVGIGATIFVIMSFSDIKYVGIEEEDSVFLEITEKHLLIEFSEKAKSLAHYEGPKVIQLEKIKDVYVGMPEPESKMSRVMGVGAKELKTGHWTSDRGEEYLFLKNLKDDPIITIELQDGKYARLILETKDAKEIVQKIKPSVYPNGLTQR